mmetsp:Transcript_23033/g.64089  ORF Transcript_23033/g.64089 Transcript_23033/m.64089 type:complete len:752 (-) Transcript_23033:106-2361(-)
MDHFDDDSPLSSAGIPSLFDNEDALATKFPAKPNETSKSPQRIRTVENVASPAAPVDSRIPTTIMLDQTETESEGLPKQSSHVIAQDVALLISPSSPSQQLNGLTEQSFSLGKIISGSTTTTSTTQSSGTLGSTNNEMVHPTAIVPSTRNNSIKDEEFTVPTPLLQLSEEDPQIMHVGCVTPFSARDTNPNGDETSIMSAAYFDLSDFSPMDWAATLTEHEVMVGLAVVYIAVGLTHPLLFLAGALTAAGTATTIGAGYDYIIEPLCFCQNPPVNNEPSLPNLADAADATTTTTAQNEKTDANKSVEHPLLIDAVPEHEEVAAPGNMDESFATVAISNKRSHVTAHLPPVSTAGSTLRAMSTLVEGLPENWVEAHYPKLEQVVVETNVLVGLNVKQFFQVFLSDNAPYNFMEFQKHRGDKNINYGSWKPMEVDNTVPISMHPTTDSTAILDFECQDYLTRTLTFQAKTNNTFFGPPYASTTKEQRLLILNKKFGVLEVRTTLADIPFCDRFHVMERWIISAEKNDEGIYQCHYNTSMQVFFSKSCPFESQIRTKTYTSLCDVCKAWSHMAKQALLRSEQHKQERIRQEQLCDGSIDSSSEAANEEKKEDEKAAPLSPRETFVDEPPCCEIEILPHDTCTRTLEDQMGQGPQVVLVASHIPEPTPSAKNQSGLPSPGLLSRTLSMGRRSRNNSSSNLSSMDASSQASSQVPPDQKNGGVRSRFARVFARRKSQSNLLSQEGNSDASGSLLQN